MVAQRVGDLDTVDARRKRWIENSPCRQRVLLQFTIPMTTGQIIRKTGLSEWACSRTIRELRRAGFVSCLNSGASHHRVYWLSRDGLEAQEYLHDLYKLPPPELYVPDIDWAAYGHATTRYREAIVLALTEALQPFHARVKARRADPRLRMTESHVHETMRALVHYGIARRVDDRGYGHSRYGLTPLGKEVQQLLWKANEPGKSLPPPL